MTPTDMRIGFASKAFPAKGDAAGASWVTTPYQTTTLNLGTAGGVDMPISTFTVLPAGWWAAIVWQHIGQGAGGVEDCNVVECLFGGE